MLLARVPCIIGDCEGTGRLKHEGDGGGGDLHYGWCGFGGFFELFVGDAVGNHYS